MAISLFFAKQPGRELLNQQSFQQQCQKSVSLSKVSYSVCTSKFYRNGRFFCRREPDTYSCLTPGFHSTIPSTLNTSWIEVGELCVLRVQWRCRCGIKADPNFRLNLARNVCEPDWRRKVGTLCRRSRWGWSRERKCVKPYLLLVLLLSLRSARYSAFTCVASTWGRICSGKTCWS